MASTVFVPIENTNLVRDMETKAVLNTDVEGQSRYRALHKKRTAEVKEGVDAKHRLQLVEQELAVIKEMLSELSHMNARV